MTKPTFQDQEILHAALVGLQHSLAVVDVKISELRRLLGGRRGTNHLTAPGPAAPKRVMSEVARRRIAAAQKKRWAAFRKARESQ